MYASGAEIKVGKSPTEIFEPNNLIN